MLKSWCVRFFLSDLGWDYAGLTALSPIKLDHYVRIHVLEPGSQPAKIPKVRFYRVDPSGSGSPPSFEDSYVAPQRPKVVRLKYLPDTVLKELPCENRIFFCLECRQTGGGADASVYSLHEFNLHQNHKWVLLHKGYMLPSLD